MPPIYIPPPRPVIHHHQPRPPVQLFKNSWPASQRIQQMQNQARLQKEIMHSFFENLTKLMEQLKDALKG